MRTKRTLKNCFVVYVYVNGELVERYITAEEAEEMNRREQYLRERANGLF